MGVPFPPILGHCRRCDADFPLTDVLERSDGCCPHCGWILSPDYSALLREQARIAHHAHQALIGALRRLVGLPGNFEVLPHSIFLPLFEEVGGWREQLHAEPQLAHRELAQLRAAIADWERLSEGEKLAQRAGLVRRARIVARHLRRASVIIDARDGLEGTDGAALRDSAVRLDHAIDRFVDSGNGADLDKSVVMAETNAANALSPAVSHENEQIDER